MTKVNVISGFLGAGKTTLIQKLIQDVFAGQKVVLVENEFGEIGIDGGFLKEAGIQINEINSGCICCTLKGDFEAALQKVVDEYHPDHIIIEPSGVGKLSDILKAVQTVENMEIDSYSTVVDAARCKVYHKNFKEFFDDQIATATCVILSRTQNVDETKLNDDVAIIRELNPNARIITTPWSELSGQAIFDAMTGSTNGFPEDLEDDEDVCPCCGHHHDEDEECEHEHHEHHHHHDHDDEDEDTCPCCGHHHDEDEECEHEHHEHHHHHDHDDEDEDVCPCCGHHHDEDEECEHEHHEHHHHHDHDDEDEDTCPCCGHHHDEDEECEHEHHEHHHHHDHDDEDEDVCPCCGHHHDEDEECEHEHHEHHHHDHEEESNGNHIHVGGHDHEHHHHHHHHDGEHDADEVFDSIGIETINKYTKDELLTALNGLGENIIRAKGIVPNKEGGWIFFDFVPGDIDIREGSAAYTGLITVIGVKVDVEQIKNIFGVK